MKSQIGSMMNKIEQYKQVFNFPLNFAFAGCANGSQYRLFFARVWGASGHALSRFTFWSTPLRRVVIRAAASPLDERLHVR